MVTHSVARLPGSQTSLGRRILASWQFCVFLVPAILFVRIFRYGPMFGLQLAFKSCNIRLGIWWSPWIGFAHFQRIRSINIPSLFLTAAAGAFQSPRILLMHASTPRRISCLMLWTYQDAG
jgi:ABC-type polysaccharide transport system permease subunit